ncbi:hypothetical protein MNBD_GAMMA05-1208 [hydrothermal vent metagenome]|uniref:TolB protein, periplasmic protein involved in the tonb-independent uptake of group A colicins n=1 Tax=hydrothermal vent metagenome TaxID=652676 RepID=A0A3B0WCW7_9ZZZZ
MKKWIYLFVGCLLLFNKSVYAVDPDLDWKTIESEHLYVHYAEGNKALAERALTIAEKAHLRLTKELDWYPIEKTHIVLSDETDQPNGFAFPVFFNRTVIFLAPPTSVNTLEDFDDWMTTLIVHEYTHIIHLDKSAGSPESLRNYFGRFLFLFPNLFQPSWVIEGLATHKETDEKRGVGRGQSAMFASMMRAEVAKGLQPISHVNFPVATWPAGTTRYLYGVYFMKFISEVYGEDKLQLWIEKYSNNLFPFFINTNANKTLGKNLMPLWSEYQQWLRGKFQPQIEDITAKGIVAGKQFSKEAYRTGSVQSIATAKGEEVYFVQNSGYKRSHLMHVDTKGNRKVLADLNNGAGLDLHAKAGLLLTQNEFCNYFTIYSDIYHYDVKNNKLQRLTECGRFLSARWMPDGEQIMAVHHEAGKFELQLLDKKAAFKENLWQAKRGEILGQIDVSPDGRSVVASLWRKGDGWNIERFDIASKHWTKLTRGVSIAANPQYTANGDILFSMEVNDVYNLHQYKTDTGDVTQLTNLIGGAFQSSQATTDGPIYYAGYSAEGFAIYKLELDDTEKKAIDIVELLDDTIITEPFTLTEDHLQIFDYTITPHKQRDYGAWSSLRPRWWFPTFEFSDQRSQYGVQTAGSDALAIHNYFLAANYDSKLEKPAASLSYSYASRYFLSYTRLNEIFLDIDGNLNSVSGRDVVSAAFALHDRKIQNQSDFLFSIIYDKTANNELINGSVNIESFEDHLLGFAWLYNSADFNPLSISLNDGMNVRLVAEDSDLLGSDFAGQIYTLDWRQYIRTGRESTIALRFVQGWGSDQPRPFRLGGEGANQDTLEVLLNGASSEGVFDRRKYALRGYKEGQPQLIGRRAQLLSAEWRIPIQRIERGVMTPPVGITQWFGSIFAETGSAYRNSPDTYYSSAGIEVTADINVFYNLLLRTRVGYAHGFDSDIGEDRLYLKVGSSF